MTTFLERTEPVLIVGGTGRIGRRVADRLAARRFPIRIGSRSGSPRFDWDDPWTWSVALDGIGAAYVAFAPDLCAPGAADTVAAFTEEAARAGVRRLVLLSGRGQAEAQRTERAVHDVLPATTVVRASWSPRTSARGSCWRPS